MKSSALESKPFQNPNSRPSQGERTPEPFQIESCLIHIRRAFHLLNSRYSVRLMKRSASGTGLCYSNQTFFCLIKQFTVCQLNYAKFPTGRLKGALKIFCTKKHYISPTFAVFSINPNLSSRNFIGYDGRFFSKLIKPG